MRSRLYTGWVAHERVLPAHNAFRYPVYYLALDLGELGQLDATLLRLSYNHAGAISFWDVDHGPRDGTPLRRWIDALLAQAGIDLTHGHVMLVTFPRVFGARFYPVSFWYCFAADDTPLAVLAEVHNTFHDRHNYLLHNGGKPFDWDARPTMTKAFYVSPFVQRDDVTYEFAFTEPAEQLSVTIRDMVAGSLMLTTSVSLTAEELTDASLLRAVLRHGPISVVALLRIHWQALKLALKRVPFFPHTPPPTEETSI
ncbi:MAG: DUF1365 domain-containing protein [Coriobacteriia bacterium]|nr:DUF1365 domain-containing protein [Coriobacteriia bacterium]